MNFLRSIKSLFRAPSLTAEMLDELEEQLLLADVGVATTQKFISRLRETKTQSIDEALSILKREMILTLTNHSAPCPLNSVPCSPSSPSVLYFVGVNGSGKTTTIAKFAHSLSLSVNGQRSTTSCLDPSLTVNRLPTTIPRVLLIAADTFRAAAIDQLKVWADRVGADFVGGQTGADPSSVIVDGLRSTKSSGTNVVLIDTAGRLQTKQNLIQELQKMVRMTEKELGKKPDEIFLVIDAMTGHNGLSQALIFCEAVPVTGIILTKYDSTAKGGIVFAIVEETRLPIHYIGVGEGLVDLKKFEAREFVDLMFT